MPSFPRLSIALKALRQLGFTQVALNAIYRLGLKTGYYRRTSRPDPRITALGLSAVAPLFNFPGRKDLLDVLGPKGLQSLLAEADEIAAGRVRLFGAEPVHLQLTPAGPLAHWADHETSHAPSSILHSPSSDIKFIWEPARFGWAFTLGRAFLAQGDEKYAEAFWRHFETFKAGNPPYLGPNWISAQEVGLRLMAFTWAAQVFSGSQHSTPARLATLAQAIAAHAGRIPATLLYARSQNNNHLLTEAAALYSAGLALSEHPQAEQWRKLGCKWLAWCFTHQIDSYGEYVQHSTNYQRLMLQTALWVKSLSTKEHEEKKNPGVSSCPSWMNPENLALATHWLLSLLDPETGRVPNLGANDGALIFPLAGCDFSDYRPVAGAAARAFLDHSLPAGPWDEMSLWFGLPRPENHPGPARYPGDHIYAPHSWGYLRAVQFKSRPSHADQLHFDLWWRGLNIARDAGTYLYNAPPPWDNRLAGTLVHNTVSVDGREQMTRAGRFLYLDWAEAGSKRYFETGASYLQRVSAWTEAYARLGVRHERMVTVYHDDRWAIEDRLLGLPGKEPPAHVYRLHWLLPDWEWKLENMEERIEIRLKSPHGWVTLGITTNGGMPGTSLVRGGEVLHGATLADPIRGWLSPTYTQKLTALSLAVDVQSSQDVKFISEFTFPTIDEGR